MQYWRRDGSCGCRPFCWWCNTLPHHGSMSSNDGDNLGLIRPRRFPKPSLLPLLLLLSLSWDLQIRLLLILLGSLAHNLHTRLRSRLTGWKAQKKKPNSLVGLLFGWAYGPFGYKPSPWLFFFNPSNRLWASTFSSTRSREIFREQQGGSVEVTILTPLWSITNTSMGQQSSSYSFLTPEDAMTKVCATIVGLNLLQIG